MPSVQDFLEVDVDDMSWAEINALLDRTIQRRAPMIQDVDTRVEGLVGKVRGPPIVGEGTTMFLVQFPQRCGVETQEVRKVVWGSCRVLPWYRTSGGGFTPSISMTWSLRSNDSLQRIS